MRTRPFFCSRACYPAPFVLEVNKYRWHSQKASMSKIKNSQPLKKGNNASILGNGKIIDELQATLEELTTKGLHFSEAPGLLVLNSSRAAINSGAGAECSHKHSGRNSGSRSLCITSRLFLFRRFPSRRLSFVPNPFEGGGRRSQGCSIIKPVSCVALKTVHFKFMGHDGPAFEISSNLLYNVAPVEH